MSVRLSCVILNYNDAETTEKLVKQIVDYKVLHQCYADNFLLHL